MGPGGARAPRVLVARGQSWGQVGSAPLGHSAHPGDWGRTEEAAAQPRKHRDLLGMFGTEASALSAVVLPPLAGGMRKT